MASVAFRGRPLKACCALSIKETGQVGVKMPFRVSEIRSEEDDAPLENIRNSPSDLDIEGLNALRIRSRPLVDSIANMLQGLGLQCDVSEKNPKTAQEKVKRPVVLGKYPWFTLSHIRDYLRFRTHLNSIDDFERVLEIFIRLAEAGSVSIVKVDYDKMFRPTPFGWRMIATDLRVCGTGMLVEHYMTFGDLIAVNEQWLHKVYEKWRSVATDNMTIRELAQRDRDARFSSHSYRELLFDSLLSGESVPNVLKPQYHRAQLRIADSLKNRLGLI